MPSIYFQSIIFSIITFILTLIVDSKIPMEYKIKRPLKIEIASLGQFILFILAIVVVFSIKYLNVILAGGYFTFIIIRYSKYIKDQNS